MKNQRSALQIIVVALIFVHAATIVGAVQMTVSKSEPADKPAPRADSNSMLAHAALLEKAKQGRIDVYFEGDSITRRWGTSDEQYKHFLANWRENFSAGISAILAGVAIRPRTYCGVSTTES